MLGPPPPPLPITPSNITIINIHLCTGPFHEQWRDFTINSTLQRQYSPRHNASVEITDNHLKLNRNNTHIPRHTDINSIETHKIYTENINNSQILYTPIDHRQKVDAHTLRLFKQLCRKRNSARVDEPHHPWEHPEQPLDLTQSNQYTAQLCYTRLMDDGRGHQRMGFMYQLKTQTREEIQYRFEIMS
jgi:hypothetical protein